MPYLKRAKGQRAQKYSTYRPDDPSIPSYLGGLTSPQWTGRPHMGPGNWVSPERSAVFGDEKYREHDLGYSELSNPYFNYNEADASLRDAPYEGLPDVIGKGAFVAKDLVDNWRVPSLYKGGYATKPKTVDSKYYYDADFVPFRERFGNVSASLSVPAEVVPRRPRSFQNRGPFNRPRLPERDTPRAPTSGFKSGGGGRKHDFIELPEYF